MQTTKLQEIGAESLRLANKYDAEDELRLLIDDLKYYLYLLQQRPRK